MKRIILVVVLILMIATPVMANSYYHEMTVQLDGEWKLETNIVMPEVSSGLTLEGIGSAYIHNVLIAHDSSDLANWWKLF